MSDLTHVDKHGHARMVDVGQKPPQKRIARASGKIHLSSTTLELIHDNQMKKGDVLAVAQIAGILAAKKTSELIPLCHPLALDFVSIKFDIEEDGVKTTSEVHCVGRTGVEMEALTSVSVALLTVYDMCKAVDKSMRIDEIVLVKKEKHDVEPE